MEEVVFGERRDFLFLPPSPSLSLAFLPREKRSRVGYVRSTLRSPRITNYAAIDRMFIRFVTVTGLPFTSTSVICEV